MVSCAQQDRRARREPAHNYLDDAGMLGGHRMMLVCHMPFLLSGDATGRALLPAGPRVPGSCPAATGVRSAGLGVHRERRTMSSVPLPSSRRLDPAPR